MIEGNFKPQILVALPSLKDGYFEKTVVLLCEYNESGAMGFVVNSPSTTSVDDLLQELGLQGEPENDQPIMIGGPVQPELCWVVHTPEYEGNSTTPLGENLCLSAAQEVLTSLTEGPFPSEYMLGVGYAGWGAGQLDKEIEQESWWMAELDPLNVLRYTCDGRWNMVMEQLGFNNSPYFCNTAKA